MANDKPAKPTKAKRVVKDPETFRERVLKATEESGKPKRATKVRSTSGKVVKPVARPVGKAAGKVFGSKPFRLVGKILVPAYFRSSWRELRLVTWPTWKESRALTFAVLVFATVFGIVVAVVDYGLDKIFRDILLK